MRYKDLDMWIHYRIFTLNSGIFRVLALLQLHSIAKCSVFKQVVHCTACRNCNSSRVGNVWCNADISILLTFFRFRPIVSAFSITCLIIWFRKSNTANVVRNGSRIASRNTSFNSLSGMGLEIWSCKFWKRMTNWDTVSYDSWNNCRDLLVNCLNVSNARSPFCANQLADWPSNDKTNSTILDLSSAAAIVSKLQGLFPMLLENPYYALLHQCCLDTSSKGKAYCRRPRYRIKKLLRTNLHPNNFRLNQELKTTSVRVLLMNNNIIFFDTLIYWSFTRTTTTD